MQILINSEVTYKVKKQSGCKKIQFLQTGEIFHLNKVKIKIKW